MMRPVAVPYPVPKKGVDVRVAWRKNTSALDEANKRLSASSRWYEDVRQQYGAGR